MPVDGVSEILDGLKKMGLCIVVITHREKAQLKKIIDFLGFDHYFDGLYSNYDFNNHVIDLANFAEILLNFNVNPDETLCIGSNPYGVSVAQGLGCHTALLKNPYVSDCVIVGQHVDYVLKNVYDIMPAIVDSREAKIQNRKADVSNDIWH